MRHSRSAQRRPWRSLSSSCSACGAAVGQRAPSAAARPRVRSSLLGAGMLVGELCELGGDRARVEQLGVVAAAVSEGEHGVIRIAEARGAMSRRSAPCGKTRCTANGCPKGKQIPFRAYRSNILFSFDEQWLRPYIE